MLALSHAAPSRISALATGAGIAMGVFVAPTASFAASPPISFTITLNVYQVCATDGTDCAALGPAGGDTFFANATNAIYAQAGISVSYNFVGQIDNSNFLHIDDSIAGRTFEDIASTTGNLQSSTVVDMFLVHTVNSGDAYGEGWSGSGGLVMGMDTILDYAPGGRIDTMAHELGHNLGLDPESDPQYAGSADPGHSNDPNQLMASGQIRNVPLTIADITPNGLGYDQMSAYQIAYAQQSTLLTPVPEPETLALMLAGLGFVGFLARNRRAAN